ncbi:hypothetical protein SAMN05444385_104308 [Tritonibacter mobilis]|nr:hypothetical protein SAMN05444385_104308 [Tritonibacter mobilis]
MAAVVSLTTRLLRLSCADQRRVASRRSAYAQPRAAMSQFFDAQRHGRAFDHAGGCQRL